MSEWIENTASAQRPPISIGNRPVGRNFPPMVIAEIGVNHDGQLARALDLVKLAAECGADAIKLQVFSASRLMNAASQFASYQQARVQAQTPEQMLRQYELTDEEFQQVVDEARATGLKVIATPFSIADVARAGAMGLDAIKIASPDLVNKPLLESAAKVGLPLLISTGASTLDEIDQCDCWMKDLKSQVIFLHCISSYPVGLAEAHLGWIRELSERLDQPVGYSDHTTDVISGALATAAGACVIERHLTYDKSAAGPDHAASSDPPEMMRYIRLIRHAGMMLGRGSRRVLAAEEDVRKVSRQSVVVIRPVKSGQILTRQDLDIQRPGTGIPSAQMEQVIGSRAMRDLATGELLTEAMIQRLRHPERAK